MNTIAKTAGAAAVSSTVAAAGTAAISAVVATAAKAKPENYTAEETASLVKAYNNGNGVSVDELAVQFCKTKRSIVAKLSREGVYKKQEYTTKQGGAPVSKDELVVELAKTMGVDEARLGGLEKANKPTIQLISQVIGDYVAIISAEDDEATKQSKSQAILTIANCLNVPLELVASLKLVDRDTLQFVATSLDSQFSDDTEHDAPAASKVDLTKQSERDNATVEAHEKAFGVAA